MSEAHFPTNLQLHEQSAREIDMTGKEHIWIPDTAEDEHWNRLSIKAHTEDIDLEKARAVALRIERYREVKRNLLQKALRRVDPDAIDAPIGENGTNVSVKRTERPRDALLVWAKEAGINLTLEEIDSLFPEHEGAEQFDGAWVVEQETYAEHPRENTQPLLFIEEHVAIETIQKARENIWPYLEQHGEIVADINADNAKRLLIGIPQVHHGTNMEHHLKEKKDYLGWTEMQIAIYRLQRDIVKAVGLQNVHLFLEGTLIDKDEAMQEIELLRDGKHLLAQSLIPITSLSDDSYIPQAQVDRLEQLVLEGRMSEAGSELSLLAGEQSFVQSLITESIDFSGHLHGIKDKEKMESHTRRFNAMVHQYKNCKSDELFDHHMYLGYRKWLETLHGIIIQSLICNLPTGKVGINIIGRMHYRSGHKYTPPELDGAHFEDYFEAAPELSDVNLVVVNPRGTEEDMFAQ